MKHTLRWLFLSSTIYPEMIIPQFNHLPCDDYSWVQPSTLRWLFLCSTIYPEMIILHFNQCNLPWDDYSSDQPLWPTLRWLFLSSTIVIYPEVIIPQFNHLPRGDYSSPKPNTDIIITSTGEYGITIVLVYLEVHSSQHMWHQHLQNDNSYGNCWTGRPLYSIHYQYRTHHPSEWSQFLCRSRQLKLPLHTHPIHFQTLTWNHSKSAFKKEQSVYGWWSQGKFTDKTNGLTMGYDG